MNSRPSTSPRRNVWRLISLAVLAVASAVGAPRSYCQEKPLSPSLWKLVDPKTTLVPQTLLPLLHDPLAHAEAKLSPEQVKQLEKLFAAVDGPLWRARILPPAEQRQAVTKLEAQLWKGLAETFPASVLRRIQQLELQSQGPRLLLRNDVAEFLDFDATQQQKMRSLAEATEKIVADLAEAQRAGKALQPLQTKLAASREVETKEGGALLNKSQLEKLPQVIGTAFDTTRLTRIYPRAPDFVDADGWIGASPGKLDKLRGKVVIVHFYAFQCVNCQRNLPIYSKWQKQFAGRDVVIVGIQTPETSPESDPAKIRAAAKEHGITYPVLIDLKKANWDAWANTMWPTVYVIDQEGYIRTWWQGELKWEGATGDKTIADAVENLLEAKSVK
jgi:peroxiredoxin